MFLQFPVILDGANGTELQKRGMPGNVCPEQWIMDHPEAIKDIQGRYLAAGSDVVYASTFTATEHKLNEHGIYGRVDEINRRLIEISREAVDGKALVAGDISPLGVFIRPFGTSSFEDIYEQYLEQAASLEKAGADLYVIETMTSMPELRAAVLAVRAVSDRPVFASLTCDENGHTLTGTDVCAAAQILEGMGVDAVGLNCSFGPDKMLEQIRRMSEYTSLPLLAKPNAGMPTVVDGRTAYSMEPEEIAGYFDDFARAGVAMFGACCGSDERFVEAIRRASCDFDRVYDTDGRRPHDTGMDKMLPLATERKAFRIQPDVRTGDVIRVDEDLEEKLEDAMDSDDVLITIVFDDMEEVGIFAELQHEIRKPLCIMCEDAAVLEAVLRAYQGRAMYDGKIDETVLGEYADRYGLVY